MTTLKVEHAIIQPCLCSFFNVVSSCNQSAFLVSYHMIMACIHCKCQMDSYELSHFQKMYGLGNRCIKWKFRGTTF